MFFRFSFEAIDIGLFALFPVFLLVRVLGEGVRETLNHSGHLWSKIALDVFQPRHSAVILDGVVQECGDDHVLGDWEGYLADFAHHQ